MGGFAWLPALKKVEHLLIASRYPLAVVTHDWAFSASGAVPPHSCKSGDPLAVQGSPLSIPDNLLGNL